VFDQGINSVLELIRGNGGRFESFMEIGILVYPVGVPVHFLQKAQDILYRQWQAVRYWVNLQDSLQSLT
jgi:hypothetical protein